LFGNVGNVGLGNEKYYFIGNENHIENFKDKCYSNTSENEISGSKTFNIYKKKE
jgi:hypothetical protein